MEEPDDPLPVKQVIVIRTRYPDGKGGTRKVRTGKLMAQACHASMAFFTEMLHVHNRVQLTEEQYLWVHGPFTKVCVYVETEEALWEVHAAAAAAGLTSHLITDNGLTEFGGEPTPTAVAIGPHYADKLQPVTGHLPLY